MAHQINHAMPSQKSSRVRIIGGEYRRRWIEFPDMGDLRPTPDRVRETLFNWLGQTLHGKRCLDLFAGSGALGFEAASRGAAKVVMVEKNRTAFNALRENCRKLGTGIVALRNEDAIEFVRRENSRYDVVFLDPPFQSDVLPQALSLLNGKLTQDAFVYIETGAVFAPGEGWEIAKHAKAGQVHYQLLQQVREHD